MKAALASICSRLGWALPTRLDRLHGDASARTYYRVQLENNSSLILMVMPEGAASVSEEISKASRPPAEPSFINVRRFLDACGLPTPAILHYEPEERWILLEDLGDGLLARYITADAALKRQWYERALDLLVELQRRTMAQRPSEECIAFHRSFDAELVNWEFDHFKEYLLAARGHPLSEKHAERFTTLTRAVTERIVDLPYLFTHRDFQSRNLMVRNGELVMIDFQDALRGPYIYDVVALLRDSYVAFTPDETETLLAHYAQRSGRELAAVRKDFALVTIQRKMKDAGRFVYIDRVKGNPNFLEFIPASLAYVREALATQREWHSLLELLIPYVPEWQ